MLLSAPARVGYLSGYGAKTKTAQKFTAVFIAIRIICAIRVQNYGVMMIFNPLVLGSSGLLTDDEIGGISPQVQQPTAIGFNGFNIPHERILVTDDSLILYLENKVGSDIEIIDMEGEYDETMSESTSPSSFGLSTDDGAVFTLTFPSQTLPEEGEVYRIDVVITYTNQYTGFEYVSSGMITGKV